MDGKVLLVKIAMVVERAIKQLEHESLSDNKDEFILGHDGFIDTEYLKVELCLLLFFLAPKLNSDDYVHNLDLLLFDYLYDQIIANGFLPEGLGVIAGYISAKASYGSIVKPSKLNRLDLIE